MQKLGGGKVEMARSVLTVTSEVRGDRTPIGWVHGAIWNLRDGPLIGRTGRVENATSRPNASLREPCGRDNDHI